MGRLCGRCRCEKPVEEFAWRRKARGQRDNYCRPCRADYKQEHYAANRQRYIDAAGRRRRRVIAERVALLVEFLRAHPCVDCGEADPLVLEFDISGTRSSASRRACATVAGKACSTRWQSARWFVQTVIGAAPLRGVASFARR